MPDQERLTRGERDRARPARQRLLALALASSDSRIMAALANSSRLLAQAPAFLQSEQELAPHRDLLMACIAGGAGKCRPRCRPSPPPPAPRRWLPQPPRAPSARGPCQYPPGNSPDPWPCCFAVLPTAAALPPGNLVKAFKLLVRHTILYFETMPEELALAKAAATAVVKTMCAVLPLEVDDGMQAERKDSWRREEEEGWSALAQPHPSLPPTSTQQSSVRDATDDVRVAFLWYPNTPTAPPPRLPQSATRTCHASWPAACAPRCARPQALPLWASLRAPGWGSWRRWHSTVSAAVHCHPRGDVPFLRAWACQGWLPKTSAIENCSKPRTMLPAAQLDLRFPDVGSAGPLTQVYMLLAALDTHGCPSPPILALSNALLTKAGPTAASNACEYVGGVLAALGVAQEALEAEVAAGEPNWQSPAYIVEELRRACAELRCGPGSDPHCALCAANWR